MSTENTKLVEAVARIKEASEIIDQLQAQNKELMGKLASAPKLDEKYAEKARTVVTKLASLEVDGRKLIPGDQIERFVTGFQQPQHVLGVLGQVVDHYGKLASADASGSDRFSAGSSTAVKSASVDESPMARLAAGRVAM